MIGAGEGFATAGFAAGTTLEEFFSAALEDGFSSDFAVCGAWTETGCGRV
ncbi:MAG TPA: hypothetical protein VH083_03485 [Myxococcales bacterium]|nr:hypothetical protein [Myxococcales bacterium]